MVHYLRISLQLGAVYDLLLGFLILIAGEVILGLFQGTPDAYLLRLAALPLFLLAPVYWAASRAQDIRPFRLPVYWARGFGGLYILVLVGVFKPVEWQLYSLITLLDWVWLLVHHVLWKR